MQDVAASARQITDYFNNAGDLLKTEGEVIKQIVADLRRRKSAFSNKDIIICLLEKLETESDVVQLDIYRHALEMVVQQTPDDLSA
ncbi:Biofilm development protein AriR [Paramixta manurensis]|uniref:Biofilm development protein AriR n=1 Tax=Paramixta manurensis TaxID=2740817 RepID=A0A6M8UNX3_9GAMM|nr:Biofilm development protein AriR [Erwiniaceae bacterium PD-1]